jgi:hypothetical protein
MHHLLEFVRDPVTSTKTIYAVIGLACASLVFCEWRRSK